MIKAKNTSLIKHSGQVFTPDYLVKIILDEAGYFGSDILRKHCIDNSCGDGAFLLEIIRRYASEYKTVHGSLSGIEDELAEFIHGIEIDTTAYGNCLSNLAGECVAQSILPVKFDIINADALHEHRYDGKMDFVVGNPPYVRVHNLDNNYKSVKSYSFASDGMTDLFLVFFEIGFSMLKDGGKLCYITPSSWLSSLAGARMRNYLRLNHILSSVIDLAHFQPFKATTYTLISLFVKGGNRDNIAYHTFDYNTLTKVFTDNIPYSAFDINGSFYLADKDTLCGLRRILTARLPRYVSVKNGFATLSDKVFISDTFPFDDFTIPVVKASTGVWFRAFYPYDKGGKPICKEVIFAKQEVRDYLDSNKSLLLKGSEEKVNPYWYLYGRTQALKDVYLDKLSINVTIKDINSIKISRVPSGCGVYSGLYILTDIDFGIIQKILLSKDFISYISALKNYKSGGYYTFNSKDLEAFLNYKIQQLINDGDLITKQVEQGLFGLCD